MKPATLAVVVACAAGGVILAAARALTAIMDSFESGLVFNLPEGVTWDEYWNDPGHVAS